MKGSGRYHEIGWNVKKAEKTSPRKSTSRTLKEVRQQ
jgi:hypothetical protein